VEPNKQYVEGENSSRLGYCIGLKIDLSRLSLCLGKFQHCPKPFQSKICFCIMFGLIFVPHSLPHVITVCLKTTAQIEVVVSNRVKALEESEELRQNYFEVVEAMAMHLM